MNLSLDRQVEQLIAQRVQSGQYASAEDVVSAAIYALANDSGDFAPGELDRLIAEGEASGPLVDGEKFLREWRRLRTSAKMQRP